jgi:hypothetical protein
MDHRANRDRFEKQVAASEASDVSDEKSSDDGD